MLNDEQVASYHEHGFLHIPQVFSAAEIDELSNEMNRLMKEWATTNQGWTGPWRRAYMDAETEKKSKLTAMHDLYFYSEAWMRAVTNVRLTTAMAQLLNSEVELHHSTMHVKPPGTGHPFPMHQDNPFYEHENGRYVDVLVHLDDTSHANGEIRFVDGSHKLGALQHVTMTPEGPCTPHLPFEQYRLEDTIAVPAKRGDVVCFSIHTIHGSYINTTDKPRRLVRVGYRDPHNKQIAGQSVGRPGLIVSGFRAREDGQALFSTSGPAQKEPDFAVG
jgi:ectoine hydroxylase-related dioxygenase (phytanoyl-CoA dioxygenase family)